ncbi:MAG: YARHG domain-containing protein [Butyricicoccus sp.]|nr:YARHG domain-containing protein [Butyricicoccus sp.]
MFCIHCGAKLPDGTKFCTQCGQPVDDASAAPGPAQEPIQPTQPVRPTYRPDEPPKKSRLALFAILAGILLIIAAIVVALVLFRPWMNFSNEAGAQSIFSEAVPNASDRADDDDALPADTVDWSDYTGNWSAGGYRFSLLTEGGMLKTTLTDETSSQQIIYDLSHCPESLELQFDQVTLGLLPREGGALRVTIDGRTFDAIRSNNLPPETDTPSGQTPTLNASDSGYLFYSPSTGTRSTGGVIPEDEPDLHFWPLDQFAISTADLDRLTRREIDIIRNETFARHGYVFNSEEWADFFDDYDWYSPDPSFTEDGFSKLEKQNIDTIVLYEQEKGWL